jgi:predicted lysophospholipase L1 biosynthesis ABC-type transport system permease subunit
MYLLLGAVSGLLLVAGVNVSNLMLVRASSRRGELALRSALGAGRSRLLRDAAIESVVLAIAGGALGLWLAGGLLQLILGLAPGNLLMLSSATGDLDLRAIAFALIVTLMTCIGFSVAPVWRASRLDAIEALKQHARSMPSRRDDRWQGALVTAQLALVAVLLAGAGLLLRSYVALNRVDLGFNPDGLVATPAARRARSCVRSSAVWSPPSGRRQVFRRRRYDSASRMTRGRRSRGRALRLRRSCCRGALPECRPISSTSLAFASSTAGRSRLTMARTR